MGSPATDTRLKVLAYIVAFMDTHRYAPTRDEISEAVGLTNRSSAQYHINILVKEGFLERNTRQHRMMTVTERGFGVVRAAKEVGLIDAG